MHTKVIEKIKKLLALSESTNSHEAELAMLKAQELLAKHKLSLKEVKEFTLVSSDIKDSVTQVTFTKAKWKARLAILIADNFGCYLYSQTDRTNTLVFFGREEDVTVCGIVLEYALDCITGAAGRLKYQYRSRGFSTRGLENDYALGFIKGLRQKFEEQKKANQAWGLVLVKDQEVTDAFNAKKFSSTINTGTQYQGRADAYAQGLKDGERFSVSDRITQEKNGEPLALDSGDLG